MKNHRSGQSLIDVLIASGLGAVLLVGSLAVLTPTLRGSSAAEHAQDASAAARGLMDGVRSFAAANWANVSSLTASTSYYLSYTSTGTTAVAGSYTNASTTITSSFALFPVYRSSSGAYLASPGYVDSSTLKVVVTYSSPAVKAKTMATYITRSRAFALAQTDWSGGGGLSATTSDPGSQFASSTGVLYNTTSGSLYADLSNLVSVGGGGTGVISSTTADHFAWNDTIGWINFYSSGTELLTSSKLQGYANSAAGQISTDCATTSIGNICGTSNYSVVNNGAGVLSGFAWNDTYGWISFNCSNNSGCGTSNYSVNVNASTGVFTGFAWNDIIGWISFNGIDIGIPTYRVVADWSATAGYGQLDSATIDTGVAAGAQLDGVTWQGVNPSGTDMRIQIATSSSSSGPWNYVGSDGLTSSYYAPSPGSSAGLYPWIHSPARYFRYRLSLYSDVSRSTSTRVDDVVVRWSP